MGQWHAPLDPDCPEVARFRAALDGDLMGRAMHAPLDEIWEEFAKKHRTTCNRCQAYGTAHIEADD